MLHTLDFFLRRGLWKPREAKEKMKRASSRWSLPFIEVTVMALGIIIMLVNFATVRRSR
jgi:hypothetical protein